MNMDDPIGLLREKAKKDLKKIILPESGDTRVLEGAYRIIKDKIAKILLLGDVNDVSDKLRGFGRYDENMVEIMHPETSKIFNALVDRFYEKRKHKNPNKDFFKKLLSDNHVYFAAMMLDAGLSDGFVPSSGIAPTRS